MAQTMEPKSMFPWRPPLDEQWDLEFEAVAAALKRGEAPDYARTRALANQQLRSREQLRVERIARAMAGSSVALPGWERFRLGLLGSRTLSYLPAPLGAAGLARGLLITAEEAPYDSVANFAFSPANPFGNQLDAVLVVLDEAAFAGPRPLLDAEAENMAVEEAERLLSLLAAAASQKVGAQTIFATLPPPISVAASDLATPGASARFRLRINMVLAEGAREGRWLLWDQSGVATKMGLDRWNDATMYHAAKVPFSIAACPLAADSIASLIAALRGKTARALILDLDNTIWGGVIGDDGVAGLRLGQNSPEGEAFVAFQRFVLQLRDRGVVLAACSKNNDPIAREPFQTHPEMLLKEEHFAVFQANWNDKATNIRSIADTLKLGLESIAFIDDNPAERARVRQELPLVSTIEVGSDPAHFPEHMANSGVFNHLPLNSDDIARASSYGGRAAAAEIRQRIGNYDDYLTSLGMVMTISPFDDIGRARITQLINKSNQFNLTTRRYNEEEVRRVQMADDAVGWQVRLEDRFVQHGMIGVVIVHKSPKDWTIDTWLQSCRVLERGVEHAIMNSLFQAASNAGVETIRGRYIPSGRNSMVEDFFPRMGFQRSGESADGSIDYVCPVAEYVGHEVFMTISQPASPDHGAQAHPQQNGRGPAHAALAAQAG